MSGEEQQTFLGRGWAFPPSFDRTSASVEMVENEPDIRESLEILLTTRIGERILEPRYGSDLNRFLFEPLDTTLKTYIQEIIRDAILYFEPRIIAERISLTTKPNEGMVIIDVEYLIPTVNSRNNLVFPFYIQNGQITLSPILPPSDGGSTT